MNIMLVMSSRYNDSVVIRTHKVCCATGKLAVIKYLQNVWNMPTAVSPVHLFFWTTDAWRPAQFYAARVLVPVVKNRTANVSGIENYRPIALASILSKVVRLILLGQNTSTHSTDMCIYALKEVENTYRKKNSSMFLCFLDASKAFDRINHGKLFMKQFPFIW